LMIDLIGLLDKFLYNYIFKDDLHKIGSGPYYFKEIIKGI